MNTSCTSMDCLLETSADTNTSAETSCTSVTTSSMAKDTSCTSLDTPCAAKDTYTVKETSCTSVAMPCTSVVTSYMSMVMRFTCTLCSNMCNDPRILPCQHSFCVTCLQNHINGKISESRTFPCPDCGRTFELPDGVKDTKSFARLVKRNHAIDAFKELQRNVTASVEEGSGSLLHTGPRRHSDAPRLYPHVDKREEKLRHLLTFNSRTQTCINDVEINSILVLQGDATRIVVTSDWANKCIKCFSSETKQLVGSYTFRSHPCGLAKSRDHACAAVVTLPLLKRLHFLDIHDGVRLTHTLKTKRMYYFIFVLSDNRVIASGWRQGGFVDILNPMGQVIKTFPPRVIPDPWCLVVRGQSLLVISKRGETVSCMTPTGTVMWLPCDPHIEHHLVSVGSDSDEFVYVCDEFRKCVTQMTRDGKVIRDILTPEDGVSVPVAIYCHHAEIYVAQSNGDVCIFSWTKS